MNKNIIKKILIFAAIFIGLYLRIRAALTLSFWGDEASIFIVSIRNSLRELIFLEHWDKCHPQFFYIFLHFWQKISTGAFFLRIPSLIAFIPATYFLYKIGKNTSNWLMGFLSVLFFATNYFFVNLGFQQKMYAFEMLFMFATIYYMQKILSNGSKKNHTLFILFAVLGFYTDYSFIWLWIAICLTLLVSAVTKRFSKKILLKFLKSVLTASLFMSLQIPIFLSGLSSALGLELYSGVPDYETIRGTLTEYMGLLKKTQFDATIIIVIIANTIPIINSKYKNKKFTIILLSLFCFFVTLLVSFFISQKNPIFIPRNMLVVSFIFLFLAPMIISQIKNKKNKLLAIVLFLIYIFKISNTSYKLENGFQGLDQFVEIQKAAETIDDKLTLVIISNRSYVMDPLREYYFDGYYDGIIINGYKEQWIKMTEISNFSIPNESMYENHIIFITDPMKTDGDKENIKKIKEKICQNKICYGPFTLQGQYQQQ